MTMISSLEETSIAAAFVMARREARVLADYPGPLPDSLGAAYRIQDQAIALQATAVAGWKVGRIWPPHEHLFGSNRLCGPIAARRVFEAGPHPVAMPVFQGGFAAVEAEFICVLRAVEPLQAHYTLEEAAAMIAAVHVGIEIASSPFAGINDHGPAVTVSDFGNNHGLILGPQVPDWRDQGLDDWLVSVSIDGALVGEGRSASFPDGMVGSVRFLLEQLASRGIPVTDGTLISTGAISGVHPVLPDQSAQAHFNGRHSIACRIVTAQPEAV